MNDKFENQKEKLVSIKQEISLLYQQVNYLLRNEKPLGLLDLDVLMNRTHTIYDQLCSINLGDEPLDEDLPFDAEAFSGLFGGMMQEETPTEPEAEVEQEQEVAEPEEVTPDAPAEEMPIIRVEEPVVERFTEPQTTQQPAGTEAPVEEAPVEEKPLGDEFGFFFRFEDMPEEEQEKGLEPEPVAIQTEGKVVHVMEAIPEDEIPERDRVHGEDLEKDNPLEMPQVEDEIPYNEPVDFGRSETNSVSDFFDNDDAGFELSTSETLGDKMMQEDHSLAAKLQQNPVHDLRSAIGINDKFLFVNELFGGSMEKYNKSIENLNDLKTLNGAMIYLNELKIELQWNSSNEAYQKLRDLVTRKFD
ncbi:MAG: hypothetical protein IJ057_04655 [Bacteroidales bacterium]|nr:hypothetical protein [Bacteroidales bacterium]